LDWELQVNWSRLLPFVGVHGKPVTRSQEERAINMYRHIEKGEPRLRVSPTGSHTNTNISKIDTWLAYSRLGHITSG